MRLYLHVAATTRPGEPVSPGSAVVVEVELDDDLALVPPAVRDVRHAVEMALRVAANRA